MAKTRGMGLLMLWRDVDPEHEAEFNRWYDEEHIDRLLGAGLPLRRALRGPQAAGPSTWRCTSSRRRACCASPAFLDEVRFRPSRAGSRPRAATSGRNYILNGYRQIFPARTNPVELTMGPSPYLQMGRMDMPAAMEEEFNDWYNRVYVPDYLTVPGVIRARRFVVVDGQPKYLTVYEFERADVPRGRGVEPRARRNPWTHRVRPQLRLDAGSPAVFRRIWPA